MCTCSVSGILQYWRLFPLTTYSSRFQCLWARLRCNHFDEFLQIVTTQKVVSFQKKKTKLLTSNLLSRMVLQRATTSLVLFYLTGLVTGFNPKVQMPYKAISGSSTAEISAIGSILTCNEQRTTIKECATECYNRWVNGWQVKISRSKKFSFCWLVFLTIWDSVHPRSDWSEYWKIQWIWTKLKF